MLKAWNLEQEKTRGDRIMAEEKKAPFRANHVGSLLRPPELRQAREQHQKGEITAAELRSKIAVFATR